MSNSEAKWGFRGREGFTLLEILISVVIFVLAAVPIYRHLIQGAAQEIEATKIAMARKILESFHHEILSQDFNRLVKLVPVDSIVYQAYDGAELNRRGLNLTASGVVSIQRGYKDFEMGAIFRFAEGTKNAIGVEAFVSWTRPGNAGLAKSTETMMFLVVRP